MRKFLLLLVVCAFFMPNVILAQKVKKETVGIYSYTQLPSDTRLKECKTYKVYPYGDINSYEKDKINDVFKLPGFEKKSRDAGNTDFVIKVEKYQVNIDKPEKGSREEKVKNKDGTERKVKYYYYESKATYKFKIGVYKGEEEVYYKILSGDDNVRGSESSSSSTAYENYKKARSSYLSNLSKSKLSSVDNALKEKFCYLKKSVYLRSAHIKPKKYKYDDYEAAYEKMKNGYLVLKENENAIDEVKDDLTKAIEEYKTILKESDINNKKARVNNKVTTLLYVNIAHCYFLMKDYAKASEYYGMAAQLHTNFLYCGAMKKLAVKLNKRVEANKA